MTQTTATDVMLVLDESGSISGTDFATMKTFAANLVADLDTAGLFTNGGRVGVAMFATQSRLILPLTSGTSATHVTNAINSVSQYGGYTCLTCAVETATAQLGATDAGRSRIAVILTDGAGNRRTTELPAKVAASDDARIKRIAIAVGSSVSATEIALIASDPDADHTFTFAQFGDLSGDLGAIVAAVDAPAATDVVVTPTVAAPFTASNIVASKGAATLTSGVIDWQVGDVGDETVTLTYTVTHDDSTDCGALPVHSSLTYADTESAAVTFPTVTVNVSGCPHTVAATPSTATPIVGNSHTVTATVTDDFGTAVANETVDFTVESGPHAGASLASDTTDASGVASITYSGTSVGSDSVVASADGVEGRATVDWQPAWPWSGFKAPVNNTPTVNVAKAGAAIPVKFSLDGDRGLNIFQTGSPSSRAKDCETGVAADTIEQTATAGSSGLTYDVTSDTYTYVWKTYKSWAGCRTLTLDLVGGGTHTAEFRLK